jgi:hypothetical protein
MNQKTIARPSFQIVSLARGTTQEIYPQVTPFYNDRMRLLVSNPKLARDSWTNMYGWPETANCFGTVTWVFNIQKHLETVWKEACRQGKSYEANGTGDYVSFSPNGGPGYVGPEPMRAFLEFSSIVRPVVEIAGGDIFTVWYMQPNNEECGFRPRHSGILINQDIVFEKLNINGGIHQERTLIELRNDIPVTAIDVQLRFYRLQRKIAKPQS